MVAYGEDGVRMRLAGLLRLGYGELLEEAGGLLSSFI